MKEIKLSFKISIALNQTDIHWIEEKLLRIREEIFKEVFSDVLRRIEKEAIKVTRICKKCGSFLVKNGNEPKKIRTLTRKMHLYNADVARKFIFRYLSVPLTDGCWNIFMDKTIKDISNKSSS